ncbi:MAG: low molecular weight protein-tyrosine-phosphatase [Saprospiraceae bacterium]
MKILMVCLGNICRSPLAEGILQARADALGLGWQIDSAGTGAWHTGEQPDPRSQAVARRYGIDISSQRARQFKEGDFDRFDLIFAMDQSNHDNIVRLARSKTDREKVHLIMQFTDGDVRDVPDPYWDDQGFEQVYQMLNKACDRLLEKTAQGV